MQKQILGIDISAKTLDIFSSESQKVITIANQPADIKTFLSKLDATKTMIGMENTGRYNNHLFSYLAKTQFEVYVINPQHLKKSLGLVRGKNDQVDAKRICLFIERNSTSLNTWICTPKVIEQLKLLMAERSLRVNMKKQLLSARSTYIFEKSTGLKSKVDKFNTALIKDIDIQIKKLEALILQVIKEDEQLYKQYQWIKSIPGVGNILAWAMIIKTNGFTILTDPRKLACYAGVVPFDHQSGSSLRYRPRVSHLADKSLKKILHLAAMSAIRLQNDLREYYLRKVAEGKNKMSVLNAVRNKIIHRILAVIKRQTPYKINLELS